MIYESLSGNGIWVRVVRGMNDDSCWMNSHAEVRLLCQSGL